MVSAVWTLVCGRESTTYTTTDTLSLRTRFNMPVGYVIFASWRMAAELSTALLHAFHHALVPLVMWLLFEFGCGMPLMGLASMNDFLHVIMHAAYYLATGLLWHEPRRLGRHVKRTPQMETWVDAIQSNSI